MIPPQKRSHPRFSALSPAMLVTADGVSRHCLVEDLSSSGALITGNMQLRHHQKVRLLLQLPGRAPFSLAGHIVRTASSHAAHGAHIFGLAFEQDARGQNGAAAAVTHSVQHTVLELVHNAPMQQSLSLVVADSPKVCASLVHDLMQLGRKAVATTTALDAIEWLLDGSSHFDTAFIDARCAQSESVDFLGFLSDEYPEVRRVILNAGGMTQKSQLAEPHAVLTTPLQLEQLAQIFRPAR
jgi:hypothetical protein